MKREKKKDVLREVLGFPVPDISSANVEELEVFLEKIREHKGQKVAGIEKAEARILKLLKQKGATEVLEPQWKDGENTPVPYDSGGLPVLPIVTENTSPVGDVNLLMTDIACTVAPFDKIIVGLAKDLVRKTGGCLPTLETRSVVVGAGDKEADRVIAQWQVAGTVSHEILSAIWQASVDAYERDVCGLTEKGGWPAARYEDVRGKAVVGRWGVYFGAETNFSSDTRGVIVSRKFPTAAEAKFLIQSNPRDWLALSAVASSEHRIRTETKGQITTDIELREGPEDQNDLGLSQEHLIELIVQISSVLARRKLIDRRVLMTSIFRELNRVGTRHIDRDKLFGMQEVLSVIERVLLFPLQQPELARTLDFKPESVLLVGVPGVGKTLFANYLLAGEYNAIFAPVDSDRLRVDFEAGTMKAVTPLLLKIDRIREATRLPVIPLIDDLDVVLVKETVSKFLNLMQGIREKGLYLLTSTNHPDKIDERLLEPGRISKVVYVPLPNLADRKGVLGVHCAGRPLANDDEREEVAYLMARETEG